MSFPIKYFRLASATLGKQDANTLDRKQNAFISISVEYVSISVPLEEALSIDYLLMPYPIILVCLHNFQDCRKRKRLWGQALRVIRSRYKVHGDFPPRTRDVRDGRCPSCG